MSPGLDLDVLDRDGALREAEARVSRRGLLGGAALAAGAGLAWPGRARAQSRNDADVLNYALTLEYLQESFYREAQDMGALRGPAAEAARVLGGVERAHVRAFRGLLGDRAVGRATYDFQGTTEDQRAFLRTAVALEDLAVAAYKGQATRIQSPDVLASAIGIHTVEARHAAWMRHLFGIRPAVDAFDRPRDRAAVNRLVASTRFVVARPRLERARRTPSYTG